MKANLQAHSTWMYRNLVDINIIAITRNWIGFIKLYLQKPLRDGLALHRGERTFIMTLVGGKRAIGKAEKGI